MSEKVIDIRTLSREYANREWHKRGYNIERFIEILR